MLYLLTIAPVQGGRFRRPAASTNSKTARSNRVSSKNPLRAAGTGRAHQRGSKPSVLCRRLVAAGGISRMPANLVNELAVLSDREGLPMSSPILGDRPYAPHDPWEHRLRDQSRDLDFLHAGDPGAFCRHERRD